MLKTIFSKTNILQKPIDNRKTVLDIPVELIRPNPYQPRKNFNMLSLEELCESIRTYGLIQPITVRKTVGQYYELIAGERRLRAIKILGMKNIPAIVIDISDNDSAILSLIENSHRENLHFLEECEAFYNLLNLHNISQEELAKKIGKSQSTISNKIRLLRLTPIIKNIIINNSLSEGHARAILKLHDEEIQLKILNIVCERGLNVAKTEELVERTIERITSTKIDKKKCVQGAYRDLHIFVNTLKQAIEMMKKSGVDAKASQTDMGDYVEFKIRVQKK
jgi:ParB family chromosome partitioning protein